MKVWHGRLYLLLLFTSVRWLRVFLVRYRGECRLKISGEKNLAPKESAVHWYEIGLEEHSGFNYWTMSWVADLSVTNCRRVVYSHRSRVRMLLRRGLESVCVGGCFSSRRNLIECSRKISSRRNDMTRAVGGRTEAHSVSMGVFRVVWFCRCWPRPVTIQRYVRQAPELAFLF